MVITHIIVDTRDAMGANTVNTMAERLAPSIEGWTGGKVYLRILSNLADRRLARARATWTAESIGGAPVRDGMISAYYFAAADPYRAATHNKGIMNGISAVVLATGNDTRAVEAGAHAYAARSGRYTSLTTWEASADGALTGTIEVPDAGRPGGGCHQGPSDGAGLPEDPRRGFGGGACLHHRRGRAGAKLRRHEGAGHRGHPAGPHGAARA